MKTSILLKLDPALVDTVDSVRGDVPRTVWIRRALEERLARHTSGDVRAQEGMAAVDTRGGMKLPDGRRPPR